MQFLNQVYDGFVVEAESGYDFTVQFEYDNLPDNKGEIWVVSH